MKLKTLKDLKKIAKRDKIENQQFKQCDFHPHDEDGKCLTEDRLKKK